MKKTTALFALALALASALHAQVTIGIGAGFNRTMEDLDNLEDSGYTIEQTGNLLMAEAGYRFPLKADEPLLRNINVVAGLKIGTLHLLSTESKDHQTKFALSTVPLYAFARLEAKYAYADLGVGAHFWDLKYKTETANLDNTNADVSLYFSAGASYPFFDRLTLRVGPTFAYFYIVDIGTGTSGNSYSLGAGIVLNYLFGKTEKPWTEQY